MNLIERQLLIPASPGHRDMIGQIQKTIDLEVEDGTIPVRFAITDMDDTNYQCEFGMLREIDRNKYKKLQSIFQFKQRKIERTKDFNTVFLVPTGIGSTIGGHAGDATPAARVLAEACDNLILHPNVVNASDLNEMPDNALYVEGSTITRLLMGTASLQPVRSNRLLVIIDDHEIEMFANDTINAVNAARATYGLDCTKVVKLSPPLRMIAEFTKSGSAAGTIKGLERINQVINENLDSFDAVAIASVVEVEDEYHEEYFHNHGEMINPWGGVEAMLTHAVSMLHNIPAAHSPMLESHKVADFDLGLVDPRLAAEAISMTFVQCMLKGLQRSPRIITEPDSIGESGLISAADISCLVIPDKCVGLPTLAALEQGVPVIAVKENQNLMKNNLLMLPWSPGQLHLVDNYWEAVGVMTALKAGISPDSMRRPLSDTRLEKVKLETEKPFSEGVIINLNSK
mgnify:CR=1 FL=1|jgi:hypothetical protein|tara:strand:- start:2948 stop:4318 length:1371 start_codon:yes stop_codon:yes gene_type:complete